MRGGGKWWKKECCNRVKVERDDKGFCLGYLRCTLIEVGHQVVFYFLFIFFFYLTPSDLQKDIRLGLFHWRLETWVLNFGERIMLVGSHRHVDNSSRQERNPGHSGNWCTMERPRTIESHSNTYGLRKGRCVKALPWVGRPLERYRGLRRRKQYTMITAMENLMAEEYYIFEFEN